MINGLDRLRKSFRVSTDLRVTEAGDQLRDPECDYDRKDKLLQYIDASFKHIQNTGEEATRDLQIVSSQARQVEAILADQERFANVAPVAENITVETVVGEAAHVIPKHRHLDVNLDLSRRLVALQRQGASNWFYCRFSAI